MTISLNRTIRGVWMTAWNERSRKMIPNTCTEYVIVLLWRSGELWTKCGWISDDDWKVLYSMQYFYIELFNSQRHFRNRNIVRWATTGNQCIVYCIRWRKRAEGIHVVPTSDFWVTVPLTQLFITTVPLPNILHFFVKDYRIRISNTTRPRAF